MSEPGTRELDRAAFATIAGSFVPCPLKAGAQIAAGRCVEWQQENGCHCEHALPSLRRVEKHLRDEPARKANPNDAPLAIVEERRLEQLDGVRTLIERAEAIEKARPPPPKPTLAQIYREARDGVRATRQQEILADIEQRLAKAPPAVRAAKPEEVLRARHEQVAAAVEATRAPAPPAKEQSMPRYAMGPCKQMGCEVQVATTRTKTGLCQLHRKRPEAAPAPAKAPRRAKRAAPPTLAAIAEKHAPRSAPPADIVHLLEEKLLHHQEQAAKCERALQALR